jgi:hypothetical protein
LVNCLAAAWRVHGSQSHYPVLGLKSLTSGLSRILREKLNVIDLILKNNFCDDFHGNRPLAERPWGQRKTQMPEEFPQLTGPPLGA